MQRQMEFITQVERVDSPGIVEGDLLALNGILAAANAIGRIPADTLDLFGTQIMEPAEPIDTQTEIVGNTPNSPVPTWSTRHAIKCKDDGGTGPGDETSSPSLI